MRAHGPALQWNYRAGSRESRGDLHYFGDQDGMAKLQSSPLFAALLILL